MLRQPAPKTKWFYLHLWFCMYLKLNWSLLLCPLHLLHMWLRNLIISFIAHMQRKINPEIRHRTCNLGNYLSRNWWRTRQSSEWFSTSSSTCAVLSRTWAKPKLKLLALSSYDTEVLCQCAFISVTNNHSIEIERVNDRLIEEDTPISELDDVGDDVADEILSIEEDVFRM